MRVGLRRAFVAASIAWAAALPLAPVAARVPFGSSIAYLCAAAVYAIGSVVCHQLPARSFHVGATQWPVCARCAGIYFGAAAVAMALSARRAKALRHVLHAESKVAQGFSPAKAALIVSVLPSALTLIYEWTTGDVPSNALRFAAGIPIGAAAAWVVVAACRDANQVN